MPTTPSVVDLLQAGAHFGHQSSKWHPKMKKYLFGAKNGIHIIDLEQTRSMLEAALLYAKKTALRGGSILFVGTKKQAMTAVEEAAKACGMPYVNNRWLGGTITNFTSVSTQIRKYKDLKRRQEKGELAKYTKFEQLKLNEEIKLLETKFGGVQDVTRVPDAMFVFDIRKDKTAVDEALRRGVKIIALCDSNVNPTDVDFPIPCNDDAAKTIKLMADMMAAAINEGRQEWESARARLGGTLVKQMAK